MSTIKIEVKSVAVAYGLQIPRTTVYIDGRFCYQSGNHTIVEASNLRRLLEVGYIDNIEVEEK